LVGGEHVRAGFLALLAVGLAQLIDASRAGQGAPASDVAFQRVMWLSAGISVLSLWFAARLPDLRLHDAGQAAPEAAV
jgi:hypothetical protein